MTLQERVAQYCEDYSLGGETDSSVTDLMALLQSVRDEAREEAKQIIERVANVGVVMEDERLGYKEVQIDCELIDDARNFLRSLKGQEVKWEKQE